jgi:hypothetical protein
MFPDADQDGTIERKDLLLFTKRNGQFMQGTQNKHLIKEINMITERKKVTAIILLILVLFVMPALASAAGGETSAAPSSTDGANTYGSAYRGSGDTMYNVKFVNENGDVLQDSYVAAGEVPVYKGEEPVKDPDGPLRYIFTGWDPEIGPVTGTVTYTAVYKCMYPFTYFGKDGERLGTAYVEDNSLDLVRVKLKAYRGYEFSGFKIQILNGDGAIICEGEQDAIVDFVPAEALADDVWSKVHADENVVSVSLFARYVKNYREYSYDIYYNVAGTRTDSKAHYVANVGTPLCLTAPAVYTDETGTYNFSHWLIEGKGYPSASIDVWPTREGNYEAVACYVVEEPQGEPTVVMNDFFTEVINGSHLICATMTYSLPDGYTLLETGFRYASTEAKANMENAYYSVFHTSMPSGTYPLHYMPISDTSAYYLAAYLRYRDTDGAEYTIYADVSNVNGRKYRYQDTDFVRVCWNVLY